MKYLIDTQILIWSIISPEKLSLRTKYILENEEIFVSQITLFEIAIKQKIGKLPELNIPINSLIEIMLKDNFNILHIENKHIEAYDAIPLLADHKDPFDRLILATVFSENIPIISSDANFEYYSSQIKLITNN